jgi:cytochrome P450
MFRVRFGSRNLVVISDPKLAESMYRARPDTFRRFRNVEPVFEELRMAGVFSAEGEAWRAQRRLAMEALSQRHLRGFYPRLAQVAGRLLRRWNEAADSGRTLDVADEFKRFTVDVTTLLVFGHDLNTLDRGDEDVLQRHLEHVFPALNRRLRAPFPYWRYVRLPADRRLDRALREVHSWLTSIIDGARGRLAADPERAEKPANFIEAMLTARDAEGRPFTDDVIFGNALTMLLAGEDTTAYTLAWAVHHLCDSAAAAAALRKEADAVIGDARVPADLEHANRLTYAGAVGNEAMRLRPVVPIFSFEPLEDVVVGDVAIPKGTPVMMLSRIPTRDAARFERPLEFAPERWIEAGAGGKAHDAAVHVPFGSGPRICPGRTLAILEMRVALATAYGSFDVERVGQAADVSEVLAFTMAPRGLHVRLRRRAS